MSPKYYQQTINAFYLVVVFVVCNKFMDYVSMNGYTPFFSAPASTHLSNLTFWHCEWLYVVRQASLVNKRKKERAVKVTAALQHMWPMARVNYFRCHGDMVQANKLNREGRVRINIYLYLFMLGHLTLIHQELSQGIVMGRTKHKLRHLYCYCIFFSSFYFGVFNPLP